MTNGGHGVKLPRLIQSWYNASMSEHPRAQNAAELAGHSLTRESNEELLRKIQTLLDRPEDDLKEVLLKEMLSNVIKLSEHDLDTLDIKILHRALKELRHGFKMFQAYRNHRKVSIFGSARIGADDTNYQLAYRFARLLSKHDFMVITGGADGIMRAGHEGAGKEHSFGVNIMLPFEQAPNVVIADDPKLVNLKYFFTRKLLFVKESHASALFPGGFGTLDEGYEVLTLIQTGKTDPKPVACLQGPGCNYWDRWLDFIVDELLPRRLISEQDLRLFKIFESEEAAVEEIRTFYRNFHSIRFVNQRLVLRIWHPLTADQLARFAIDFADLLAADTFEQRGPLPEELDEPELNHLSRLVFRYNRRSAGRLRELIDRINAVPQASEPSEATPVLPNPR